MNKQEIKDYLIEYLQINIRDVDEYKQIESYVLDLYNQPTPLDSEVEEAIERIINKKEFTVGYLHPEFGADTFEVEIDMADEFGEELDLIKQALRQSEEYKNHYKLNRKLALDFQSKLNAIEEVVKKTVYESDRNIGEFFVSEAFNKIKQILGNNNEK